jgi:N-acetyl-gamma-glutamyl-phosphate reductase
MIKVGVSGCGNLQAQELVRVLVNHPDVELKWVSSHKHADMKLDRVVPGLMGESDLTVVAAGTLNDVDLVFLCGSRAQVTSQLTAAQLPEDIRLIDLSGSHNLSHGVDLPWRYGLSEMQRRILVHGTRLVTVPGNAAAASLLALMPLARNLMINNPLSLHVELGQSVLSSDGKTVGGMTLNDWSADQRQEIEFALRQCQSSFNQAVDLEIRPLAQRRMLTATARLKCGMECDALRELYEQYYDDHNFVFIVDRPITQADVENTSKCLININKDDSSGMLTVSAVMDVLLKGGAGMAVHAMNLMFGLHERVGLALKGTGC